MKKLAEAFPGAFLVFAALKDELTETERATIGPLVTWGRELVRDGRPRAPVIALTGTELFSAWQVEQTWRDLGGKRAEFVKHPSVRIDNLWTLAEITQQMYLGLPHPHARVDPASRPGQT